MADCVLAGGGFPLKLRGVGCVGAVTVSGLPQREDHEMVVAALAAALGSRRRAGGWRCRSEAESRSTGGRTAMSGVVPGAMV